MPHRAVLAVAPFVFVVLWASGFIVAHAVIGTVEPLTFLAIRFGATALVLAILAAAIGSRWPADPRGWRDAAIAGILMQGVNLGCIFWAVAQGLPSAISALIAGTQPLVTAILARPLLGEPVRWRAWLGVAVGFLGLALVVWPRLQPGDAIPKIAFVVTMLGTLGMTAGTIWQKRTAKRLDLVAGTAIQYMAATPVVGLAAWLGETGRIDLSPAFWAALLWAVFGLSIGAVGLFLWMVNRGGVVAVTSLLFLVPPVTALMGFALFGDRLVWLQVGGMALAALGVALATRRERHAGD